MSTDPAAAPSQQVPTDLHSSFIEASTKREFQHTLSLSDGVERIVTLRRWSLREQFTLGTLLSRIMHSMVAISELTMKKLADSAQGAPTLAAVMSNQAVIAQVFSSHVDDVIDLLVGTLKHNFDDDVNATTKFVNDLDPADALELVLIIMTHNKASEKAKKKFLDNAKALGSKVV